LGGDEEESESEPSFDIDAHKRALFSDCGLYFDHAGKTRWSLIVPRTVVHHIEISDPLPDGSGVNLKWESKGPSDQELVEMEQVTESGVREFSLLEETSGTLFIPAPNPISPHFHSQKRGLVPEKHPKWLVVSFLWNEEEEEHNVGEIDEFDFEQELQKEMASRSSSSKQ
jgi:hypothetical protein